MYKQKLIDHLYQYTSKELSFGCRVKLDTTDKETTYVCNGYENTTFWIKSDETDSPTELSRWSTGYHILGHPPQWHHLLLALGGTPYTWKMDKYGWIEFAPFPAGKEVKLHMDFTTNLQDIPEKDAEKLCQLLNIG